MEKKLLAKVNALFLAFVLFTCSFTFNVKQVKAATNLEFNQTYSMTVATRSSSEFTFTTPASGFFRLEVSMTDYKNREGESSYGSQFSVIMNVGGENLLYDYVSRSDPNSCSNNYSFAPSTPGSVKISADVGFIGTYYYTITLVNETPANFETENNNSTKTADTLKLKKTYSGILRKGDKDNDWFVFKAPKTGNYKFMVCNTDDATSGDFFYFHGYTSKNKMDSKNKYKTAYAGKGYISTKKVHLKKGKKYYVRICSAIYESTPYEIKVKKVK